VAACVSFFLLATSPLFWSLRRYMLEAHKNSSNAQAKAKKKSLLDTTKIDKFLSPTIIGSIFGVVIGSILFLRNACMAPNAIGAPVYSALCSLGNAYLPAALLIFAGSLVGPPSSTTKEPVALPSPPQQQEKLTVSRRAVLARHRFSPLPCTRPWTSFTCSARDDR
jgi:predicted permease